MPSRSDHVHSHQFTVARVTAALAAREADPARSPVRRSAGSAFAGAMLALVALAAVGVVGVLRPGDDPSWRDGRSIIIERETGASFVYRDGVLHPTLNHASALLILAGAQPASVVVSHAALAGVPRGVPLGIAGAPDPLPARGDLLTGAWSLCSRTATGAPDGPGPAESLLVVGAAPGGGVSPLGDRAVLVADAAGGEHMLWHGHRYDIAAPAVVLTALGWRDQPPIPVAAALLNAVPVGPDLAPLRVSGRGRPSAFQGHRVGEVVVAEGGSGTRQYGLVVAVGLAAITALQADLLLADPASGGTAAELTPAQYAAAPAAPPLAPAGDAAPPSSPPPLARPGGHGGVCSSFVDAGTPPAIGLPATRPTGPGETRVRAGGPAGVAPAGVAPAGVAPSGVAPSGVAPSGGVDWVAVAPGRGALVEALPAASSPGGLIGVVSDLGLLFPVPSAAVLATLGYAGAHPQRLPSALVALLPTGNTLDPVAAGAVPG